MKARNFSLSDALDVLDDAFDFAIRDNKRFHINQFEFNKDNDGSGVKPAPRIVAMPQTLTYNVSIGVKELYDNCDEDGMVRDVDLMWGVKHVFHEARHLEKAYGTYQGHLSGSDAEMAMIEVSGTVFEAYKDRVYFYAPHEIDAELYAYPSTVDYFNKHIVDDNGDPLIDAEATMFEALQNYPQNRVFHVGINVDSFSKAMRILERMAPLHRQIDKDFCLGDSAIDQYAKEQLQKMSPKWREVLHAECPRGPAYDQAVFLMACEVNPTVLKYFKGVKMLQAEVETLDPVATVIKANSIAKQDKINKAMGKFEAIHSLPGLQYDDLFDF